MTVGLEPAPAPAYPHPVVLDKVPADPHSARRLAQAYRDAAHSAERARSQLHRVMADVEWQGAGASARWLPAEVLSRELRQVAHGLMEAARSLEHYARQLEKAHEKHHWSLKRLAAIGAIVVVTAAAVTVTMGAAAVAVGTAEAALAEGALAGVAGAVATASAAEATAAGSLMSSAGLMAGVRALAAFALPKLAQAEVVAGASALSQEVFQGEIRASRVLMDAQLAFVGSGAASLGLRAVRGAELSGAAAWAAPHLVVGGATAGTSALAQWEGTGSVSATRVLRDGALGAYFSGVGWTIAQNGGIAGATRREIELSKKYNWNNPDRLQKHVDDHAADLGDPDVESYLRRSVLLRTRIFGGQGVIKWDAETDTFRVYDPTTNEFGAYSGALKTRSLFPPSRGMGYFLKQDGVIVQGQDLVDEWIRERGLMQRAR